MNGAEGHRTYPLTDAQRGVVMAIVADPASTAYNLPCEIALPDVDIPRLEQALRTIVAERPALRTRFCETVAGDFVQYASADASVEIPRRSMSEEEARQYAERHFARPFHLFSDEPLCRFEIIQTPEATHLLADVSHAIADGLTLARWLLQRDLPDAYAGRKLCEARMSIFDIAEAEAAACGKAGYKAGRRWFLKRFADVEFSHVSAEKPDHRGRLRTAEVKMPRRNAERWCRRYGVRPELLFLGSFGLTLAKLSGTESPAFGILHHGRSGRDALRAYGMLVRTLPIRICAEGKLMKRRYFELLGKNEADTLQHAAYPTSHLYREIGATPAVTFGFQTSSIREMLCLDGKMLPGRQLPRSGVRGDLSCTIYSDEKNFLLRLETSTEQHTTATLTQMVRAMKHCAEQLMRDDTRRIGEISLASAKEIIRIKGLSRGERIAATEAADLRQRVRENMIKRPDAVAISDENGTTTYWELGYLVVRRAKELRRMGVQKGDLVGISSAHTRNFVVDILALWALGAAFSPAREGTKREGAEILRHNMPTERGGTAYVMYTSGSTGTPKGVVIPHEAVANLAAFIHETWRITQKSRIACHSSFAFDAALEDIFGALHAGATLCIVPEAIRRDPEGLCRYLAAEGITGGCYTTSFGMQLRTQDIRLSYLCLGGELLTQRPRVHARTRILNTYGPTEFCVDATWHELAPRRHYREIPIGRPVWNAAAYVVDVHGQLLPQGFHGELWLAGPQTATGYLDDEALTAEMFVKTSFSAERAYRTGDIVRWNERGELIFIGRRDRQVKLRGYRIEPAEIESAMRSIEGVREAATDVRRVDKRLEICAFYTASRRLEPAELRNALRARLPEYMIPSRIQQVEAFPLNASGKTNLRMLPTPRAQQISTEAPHGEKERLWCETFAEVLGVSDVGRDTDFFEAGGTSLMVVELVAAARSRHLEAAYSDIFTWTTPAELAARQTKKQSGGSTAHSMPETTGYVPAKDFAHAPFLVTGAAGFLGAHVLHELWLRTDRDIACFVHDRGTATTQEQLLASLAYYFGDDVAQRIVGDTRITIGGGDIVSYHDWEQFAAIPHPIVIHAAADVRQFARNNEITETNVVGTQNAIRFCQATGGFLYHVSTTSVAGFSKYGSGPTPPLKEDEVLLGQHTPTEYVASKLYAEGCIDIAVKKHSLRAHILRIGNLAPRSTDGKFQPEAGRSGFLQLLAALRAEIKKGGELSEAGKLLAAMTADVSPVDIVAQKIAEIVVATSTDAPRTIASHIFSRRKLSLLEIIQENTPFADLVPEQPAFSVEDLAKALQEMRPNNVCEGKNCF